MRIYLLLLLLACVMATIKLIRIWRAAPPFKSSEDLSNPAYRQLLRASRTGLNQWIACVLITWGILGSTAVYDDCEGMLASKHFTHSMILFALQDFSVSLSVALVAVLFLFLVRWHVLRRIERLRRIAFSERERIKANSPGN